MVAAPPGHEREFAAIAGEARIVTGAASRAGSVATALAEVETELVVVHDAARPLAGSALFDRVLAALADDPGAAAAIAASPVADTLKRAGPAGSAPPEVAATVPREGLWAAQTPQAFRTGALRDAQAAAADLDAATDEALLVERAGGRVLLVAAPSTNLKVTTRDDLALAEALLRSA